MAAHLHDSVLQTLALIQKHAADGRTVATLARAQERDLRSWLYDAEPPARHLGGERPEGGGGRGRGRPRRARSRWSPSATRAVSERLRPLVLAAREAMVNAAKHSGADQVDVYAECTRPAASRCSSATGGTASTRSAVPEDRLGVRNSIVDRMRRHGGTAGDPHRARRGHRGPAAP